MEPSVPWTNQSCLWPIGTGFQQNTLLSQLPRLDCPSTSMDGGVGREAPAKPFPAQSKSGQGGREVKD